MDIASIDPKGAEIDRVQNIPLNMIQGFDGEPSEVIYRSSLEKPIIFVDTALEKANYPNLVILRGEDGSTTAIVVSQP